MAIVEIQAILWRSYLAATSTALWGESTSQYYIDLPRSDFETFLTPNAIVGIDKDSNQTYTITLEAFDGDPAVGEYKIVFKKLRAGTAREGTWNINGQSPEKAYPLWRPERGPLKVFSQMTPAEKSSNFLVIVRDLNGRFHGRWIQSSDFDALPDSIRQKLMSAPAGWATL